MLRMLSTATTVRKPGQSRKGFEQNGLRTGEDSAADQTSMFVIELVGGRPVGCAKCKTGFQAMIAHRGKDLALIGLERDEIIGAPFEDLADDRFLAAHRVQGHDAALEIQRVESGTAVISFDLSPTWRWPSTRPRSLAQALTICSGP